MTEEKRISLLGALLKNEDQYAGALPAFMAGQSERLLTVFASTVSGSPQLQKCSLPSLQRAAMMSAQTGLLVDGVLGQAYLVPMGGEAVFMAGYKGLMKLARNSGEIQRIEAHLVYQGELFSIQYGDDPRLEHKPCYRSARGEIVGAYAISFMHQGRPQFHFMEEEELCEMRDKHSRGHQFAKSKGRESTWDKNPEAMRLKTVARHLCKWLPTDYEPLQRAVGLDEQHEAGVRVPEYDVQDDAPAEYDDLAPAEEDDEGEREVQPEIDPEDVPF